MGIGQRIWLYMDDVDLITTLRQHSGLTEASICTGLC